MKIPITLSLLLFCLNAAAAPTNGQNSQQSTGHALSVQIEAIMKDLSAKKKKMNQDYALAMKNIGWFTIMDFKLLKKNSDITKKQKIADKAIKIIRTHKNKITAFKAYSRNALENIQASAEEKKTLLAGYDQGTRSKKARAAKRYWDLEEKVAGSVKAMIDMLAAHQADWQIRNGRLEFRDQKLIERYNSHIDSINRSIEMQNTLRRQAGK